MRPRPAVRRAGCALAAAALVLGTNLAPAAATVAGQYWVHGLGLEQVWKATKGAGVTVAVVDTGTVPVADLAGRVLPGKDFSGTSSDGRADSGSPGSGGGLYSDGTSLAEEIAGNGAGGRIDGIAPAARILPVKVSVGSGFLPDSATVDAGIRWAVQQGAKIITVSYVYQDQCVAADASAARFAYDHGAIVVAAVGQISADGGLTFVGTPAKCPGVLAVAGVQRTGAPWGESARGPEVDIANYATDVPAAAVSGGGTTSTSGTGAAAAFTSGELALLWSQYPHDTARQIVQRLTAGIGAPSAHRAGTRISDQVGYGVPSIRSALAARVAATAPNPIYDQWQHELGAPTGKPFSPGSATHTPSASTHTSDSGLSASTVVLIVVLVLLAGAAALVIVRRSRRQRAGRAHSTWAQ